MTGGRVSARGEDTRRRLLRAAFELFGQRDFDDVTTRQLADAAAVNLAAIPYHFGSKENIYLAVAEQIVASIQPQTRAAIARAREIAASSAQPPAQLEAMKSLLLAFSHEVIAVPDAELRAGFILREQFRPSQAFDVLYEGFICDVHEAFTGLFAALLQEDAVASPAMLFRTQSIIGQILGFRMGQEVLLRRLGAADLDPETVANFIADQNIAILKREIGYA